MKTLSFDRKVYIGRLAVRRCVEGKGVKGESCFRRLGNTFNFIIGANLNKGKQIIQR